MDAEDKAWLNDKPVGVNGNGRKIEKKCLFPNVAILSGQTLTLPPVMSNWASPALVLLPQFSIKNFLALVAPVTSMVQGHGFEVGFSRRKRFPVLFCHQVKTIDFVERC